MTFVRPLGVLSLSLVCFLAAQGTGIRLFFHLFYLLLALLLVSFAWGWLNVQGLEVRRETLTHRTHVGEHARERLILRNRWPLPRLWLEVRDRSDLPLYKGAFVSALGGSQQVRHIARTPCIHRGKFTQGPISVFSGDPFGIVRLERRFPLMSEIVVYPRMVDLADFALPEADLPGGQHVHSRAHNVTPNVVTVRDYAPGDSFNRIHWRSTARTGMLMVKEFELDPTAEIYLVLDMQERTVVTAPAPPPVRRTRSDEWWAAMRGQSETPLLHESTEEYLVTAAASLARQLLAQNRVVGMVAWGQHREIIPAEREARQLFKMLEALAMLRAYGVEPLAEVLVAEGQRFSRNTTLIVLTASTDERWPAALQQLLYRGVGAVVIFVDPRSFDDWHDPEPLIERLTILRVPAYRIERGQSIPAALRKPITIR